MELSQSAATQEVGGGALGRAVTEHVIEYIMQNLSDEISLEDRAKVAGLTRFHFVRRFGRAMQKTPYQHLLRRRIERAQELLHA